MIAIAGGVTFLGYWLFCYGLSQVRGCNAGMIALVWPGRFSGCDPDTGGGQKSSSGGAVNNGKCGAGFVPDAAGNCIPIVVGKK